MAMQNETQAVYAKYGVSPMGSCVQMLIQLPNHPEAVSFLAYLQRVKIAEREPVILTHLSNRWYHIFIRKYLHGTIYWLRLIKQNVKH